MRPQRIIVCSLVGVVGNYFLCQLTRLRVPMSDILHQIAANPWDNVKGILLILVLLGIAFKLAPRGVSIAGHDAGQLFLLAALPLFFIDFATSARSNSPE